MTISTSPFKSSLSPCPIRVPTATSGAGRIAIGPARRTLPACRSTVNRLSARAGRQAAGSPWASVPESSLLRHVDAPDIAYVPPARRMPTPTKFARWMSDSKFGGNALVNGPATEIPLLEALEDAEDEFRAMCADGVITPIEAAAHLRRLRGAVTQLSDYAQERQILRALDRRGLDSAWARRVLVNRWAKEPIPFPQKEGMPLDDDAA